MPDQRGDANTLRAVREALEGDERLSSQLIDVEVSGGRVVLTGRVQSSRRKLAAQEVAEEAAGPAEIDNRLEVSLAEIPSDEEVAERVRSLIAHDDQLMKHAVLVDVRAGRVTLSGAVASRDERNLAEDVALQAAGVEHVANHLVVEPEARTESVVVASELEHELGADPRLRGCAFQVAISGDVAVLAGTAITAAQVETAVESVRKYWVGELREEVTLAK